jgi:parvulin-like peptidyl-prolyl isomerase
MADKLNFTVPETAAVRPRGGRGIAVVLVLIALLQLGVIGVVLWPRVGGGGRSVSGGKLGVDAQRELALKLEKQGLTESAVAAWQAYLAAKGGEAGKASEIWYRIGTLWQDAGRYEPALAAYYTSESFGRLPNLESEVGRRVQECLDALGKYAALRYELKDRTAVGGDTAAGDDVVAEIGPRKITKLDLDRLVEQLVSAQLERFGRSLTPEQREQRKGELMKQFGDNQVRRQVLGQYLAQEILSRKAREERLTDQPEVRAQLQEAERGILASELVARQVAAKVNVTSSDVKTYYEANKEQFKEPERARVAHIQVADEEKAKALLASLAEGQSFDELARTLSQDSQSAAKLGVLDGFVVAGRDEAPGLGQVEGLAEAVFATAAGSIVPRPLRSAKGWHVMRVGERVPESLPAFEKVEQDAYQRLHTEKEREAQEAFLKELYKAYDVVVHQRALGAAEDSSSPAAGAASSSPKP